LARTLAPLEQTSEPSRKKVVSPEPVPQIDTHQAGTRFEDAAAGQFDVEGFWQKVRSGKVPLALNNKGAVDENCLSKAGVPRHVLANVSADIRFVMTAAEQAGLAIRQIGAHLSRHPGHLVHQDRLSLSPEAPEHLRDLWNFHLHDQRSRQKASDLFSRFGLEDKLSATAVDSGGDPSPIGPLPGQQKDVIIDPPRGALRVMPDAASKEAQRLRQSALPWSVGDKKVRACKIKPVFLALRAGLHQFGTCRLPTQQKKQSVLCFPS
jgi:hypothetical protein